MNRSLMWLCTALAFTGLAACAHQEGGVQPGAQAASSLSAYHWQLDKALDGGGNSQPQWIGSGGKPVTLTFKDQRLSVAGLCNAMGASYQTTGTKMHISQVTSTMRMCSDADLMKYEQAVGQRLPEVSAWSIDEAQSGPTLTLRFEDGGQWLLEGEPTAETRYGSAGEIMFLEIAPQEVACAHPLIPNKQCLNVRTVQYDAAGIKLGHGPWQPLYESIEGYQHEPGVRNVLRVKRYTRKDVPADASRYAYVLDMTVESEAAKSSQ